MQYFFINNNPLMYALVLNNFKKFQINPRLNSKDSLFASPCIYVNEYLCSLILKLNIKCHSCMLNALTVIIHSIIIIIIVILISSRYRYLAIDRYSNLKHERHSLSPPPSTHQDIDDEDGATSIFV